MLIVLSPAKTLDFATPLPAHKATQPALLEQAQQLNQQLRPLSARGLSKLMHISDELAQQNADRNQQWQRPFTSKNARQAIFAFRGDVYLGLDADSFSAEDLAFSQGHLRILSGLYGVLRPLDLMQPYRLEMGTMLQTPAARNLYEFWGSTITGELNKALTGHTSKTLVNLASQEYFGAVQPQVLKAAIVTPAFKDFKNGDYKIISFFAKKARGSMAAWLLKNRVEDPAQLQEFAEGGYKFNNALSKPHELLFTRKQ